MVLRGKFEKTTGGLRAESLMRNKRGKVVSKRKSAANARTSKDWIDSVISARKLLNLDGFVAINGKSSQGKSCLRRKTAWKSVDQERVCKFELVHVGKERWGRAFLCWTQQSLADGRLFLWEIFTKAIW